MEVIIITAIEFPAWAIREGVALTGGLFASGSSYIEPETST